MSRGGFRGGRGGRGGGRGGFGRGGAQTGLDIEGLDLSFRDVPLFPDMALPPIFKKVTDDERHLLDIDKKWMSQFKDSPFHLEIPPVRDDIERYSDKFKSWARPKNKSLISVKTDLKYFPDELHQVKDPSKKPSTGSAKPAKGDVNLEKVLRDAEKDEQTQNKRAKIGDSEEDEEIDPHDYDEEDEEDDDYVNNYYEDDDDGAGGDDSDHGLPSFYILIDLLTLTLIHNFAGDYS
ncbi:hypothetical protein HK100_010214 [Physocladia obscura]|uniref:DNA-directed RNA polymerase III subunit n=1 Tax=Physocladia obscura TaxID=109957 RepID=A0AAD5T8N3_9FUNG|nr:hypothetical protein HK100_010214 [Physocladia obscura]